jgi:hypothetical protein
VAGRVPREACSRPGARDNPVLPPRVARRFFRKPCGAWLSRTTLAGRTSRGPRAGEAMAAPRSDGPVAGVRRGASAKGAMGGSRPPTWWAAPVSCGSPPARVWGQAPGDQGHARHRLRVMGSPAAGAGPRWRRVGTPRRHRGRGRRSAPAPPRPACARGPHRSGPSRRSCGGGATRAGRDDRRAVAGAAGDAMDAGGLEHFGQRHRWHDRGETAGQHRLARPG